ncbi:myosin-2 heavy chain, non muscle [Ceratobasidium sp. AG-Ba]|nr:myosin-2 heavy chain, non muscle [Ceratobasidium sp. AG-Ba]
MSSTPGASTSRAGASGPSNQQDDSVAAFGAALNATKNKQRWADPPPADLPPELNNEKARTQRLLNLAGIKEGTRMGVAFAHRLQGVGGGSSISGLNNRRRTMELKWEVYIIWVDPDVDPTDHWLNEVVVGHWEDFFYAMVDLTPGRSGEDGKTLRSATVYEWSQTWSWLVLQKCVNREGAKVGQHVLYKQGVYRQLKDRVLWFSHHFQLDRHIKPQSFVGRAPLLLMMRAGYKKTEVYSRVPFQQSCVALSLVCQIAARMGSLGFSTPAHLAKQMYAKLEDVKIIRVSYCRWKVIFNLKYRKGHNWVADAGHITRYTLEPVTKIHNLWFDFGVHLVSFLHMRKAIQGCETLQDIFESKLEELRIKPDMRKEPLFLARTAKGEDLVPSKAASAKGLTRTFQVLAEDCGFYGFTSHGIRRESGDRLGLLLGTEVAQEVLVHDEDRTTYHRSYSRNTLNIPVTLAMEGELDAQAPAVNQIALRRNSVTDMVLDSIIDSIERICSRPGNSDDAIIEGRAVAVVLTDEDMATANEDKEVERAQFDLDGLWGTYYEKMPSQAKITHGQRDIESIGKAFERYKNNEHYKKNQDELEKIRASLQVLGEKRSAALRVAVRRIHQVDEAREKVEELLESNNSVPDLDLSRFLLTADSVSKGDFGQGVLTEAAITTLRQAGLMDELLSEHIRDDEVARENAEAEPFDDSNDNENGIEVQENAGQFNDAHEKQVFDVDMAEAVKKFMISMNLPVEMSESREKIAKANGGKYRCEVCFTLPPEQRTGRYKKVLTTNTFSTKTHLDRHLDSHTEWQKLAPYMRTESPTSFKCPIFECGQKFSTVEEVQEHCTTNCDDSPVFKSLKRAHENRSRGTGTGPRTSLKARKLAAELEQGIELDDEDMAVVKWWENLTSDQVEQIALKYNLDFEELTALMPDIKEAMGSTREQIRDGKAHMVKPKRDTSQGLPPGLEDRVDEYMSSERFNQEVERRNRGEFGS